MKYYLVAGESSGDLHASWLIKAIGEQDPMAQFRFVGGNKMAHAVEEVAGRQNSGIINEQGTTHASTTGQEALVVHYKELAFMGLGAIFTNIRTILRNFKRIKQDIRDWQPHTLILVDYPAFNLPMARRLRHSGIPIYYYIAPKAWAWNARRVIPLKKYIQRVLCILPFEEDWFRQRGLDVNYVGNPLVEELAFTPKHGSGADSDSQGTNDGHIALLPGSRIHEVRSMVPVFADVIKARNQYRYQVLAAPSIDPKEYQTLVQAGAKLIIGNVKDIMGQARMALVNSGTATLETAIMGVPQIVVYKTGWLTYFLGKKVVKVSWISLVNLIAQKEVVPELVQDRCIVKEILTIMDQLCRDQSKEARHMKAGYELVRKRLGTQSASKEAAHIIYSDLQRKTDRIR